MARAALPPLFMSRPAPQLTSRAPGTGSARSASKGTMKEFLKTFVTWMLIFVVVLTPAGFLLDRLGGIRIFTGTENLMRDMDVLVDPESPFFEAFRDAKRVNVLLLGVNGGLTDTIMLGSYDMENQRVDVISIPRDTYYDRADAKSAGAKKINAIYRNGGAVGTAEAVSDVLLGMPIHYYAVVTYEGIGRIVDAIGGVPVEIPFHMHYEDPTDDPPLYIDIPEGPAVIDSSNVREFLRFRKGSKGYPGYRDGDIGRIKAQQEFIKSAFRESLGFGLPKVARSVMRNVDSDLTLSMALKIAQKATGLEREAIRTHLAPGTSGTRDGASYWWVDEAGVEEMLLDIYSLPAENELE